MELLVLSAAEVREALPMQAAVEAMNSAFARFSAGEAVMPLRSRIDVAAVGGATLFMPGFLPAEDSVDESPGSMAVKVVSVFGRNAVRGLPTIHGVVLIVDASTGCPRALLEGASLTAIRTGAASGAATDLLARAEASSVAIFGSGVQARTQLEAVCTVRNIETAWVYSPNRQHAVAFADELAGRSPFPATIRVAESPQQAVASAEIVCTATTSATPVFDGRDLRPGTHVNAVGSFMPDVQEVDVETIRRSLVVVDSREAALEEAGDLIVPINAGEFDPNDIHAELGEVISGQAAGRTSDDQFTYFKSCGMAVQDVAAAEVCYQQAVRLGLGKSVSL